MRPDEDVDLALREVGEHLLHLLGAPEARDHLDADREVAVALAEGVPVLLREDRRRREHQRLPAVDGDRERGADGDLGLAEADVAADEPVHRARRLEILLHRLDRRCLVGRLAVRELRLEPLEPLVREVEAIALARLALRVERDQLAGELLHRLARARLEQLPRLAAELRERRRLRVGADVAGDLADLLVRDVEAVLAAEREEEVVARDAGDGLRLEAEQLADAVVLVDDVVAGAQVGERLRARARRSRRRARARRLRKTCMSGSRTSPSSRQTKPRRAGETAKQQRGLVAAAALPARADAPRPGAAGSASAAPRRGAGTRRRRAARRARTPPARSRPRRGPRAAIAGRCASNAKGWPGGNGSSSVAPVERDGLESPSSSQTRRPRRLPDEVGRRGRAAGRGRPGRAGLVLVAEQSARRGRGAAPRPGRRPPRRPGGAPAA